MPQADPLVVTLERWVEVFMQRSVRDFVGYARESGLTMSQWGALFQIRRRGSCSVRDLGETLGVTSSAASQLLERLVNQGLILRSEDPGDRRAKQIALTERGRQVLQESVRARHRWLSDLAETLSSSEEKTVITALDILIDRARQIGQPVEQGN